VKYICTHNYAVYVHDLKTVAICSFMSMNYAAGKSLGQLCYTLHSSGLDPCGVVFNLAVVGKPKADGKLVPCWSVSRTPGLWNGAELTASLQALREEYRSRQDVYSSTESDEESDSGSNYEQSSKAAATM
jgi:hypothetical protein